MNTSPTAKYILCFGDSNTWGQKPDKTGRYPADVRWTGTLQDILGDDCYIIEEGLSSRTTDLEYSKKPGRNGRAYLDPCLDSHRPLDLVILMLGTNDLKIEFDRSAKQIAEATRGLIELIQEKTKKDGRVVPVLLVSPIHIIDTAPRFAEFYTGMYDHEAALKSKQLASEMKRIAQETNCTFIDAATVSEPGEDGLHLVRPRILRSVRFLLERSSWRICRVQSHWLYAYSPPKESLLGVVATVRSWHEINYDRLRQLLGSTDSL
jgi:lysophospholipase L1-like esterase